MGIVAFASGVFGETSDRVVTPTGKSCDRFPEDSRRPVRSAQLDASIPRVQICSQFTP